MGDIFPACQEQPAKLKTKKNHAIKARANLKTDLAREGARLREQAASNARRPASLPIQRRDVVR